MKIQGAIFDMDGTLVDSLGLWDVLWEEFGQKYCGGAPFSPDPETDRAIRTMTLDAAMDLLHDRCKIGANGADLLTTANETFARFYGTSIELKPGIREFLEACLSAGIPMCIASATDRTLLEIGIAHCGLDRYFSTVLSCATIGKGKDQPDIYLLALETLGTPKESTWVFEDSYVALNTASSIGLPTVGIYDRYNFDQDKLQAKSVHYIAAGETVAKLLPLE